jgi:hypothetical protein
LQHATGVVVNPDGTLQLTGSNVAFASHPGTAIVSNTLDAALVTSQPTVHLPEINILGDRIALLNATVDASSTNSGGVVRIGGDYQGQGIFTASQTYVSPDSMLRADALQQGDGG